MARDLGALKVDKDGLYQLSYMTGSLRFMAPEVALAKPYNETCDIHSFSILLWTMLALEKPFKDLTREQVEFVEKVFIGGCRPPVPGNWPEQLRQLLPRGWHVDSKKRPDMNTIRGVLRQELLMCCDVTCNTDLSDHIVKSDIGWEKRPGMAVARSLKSWMSLRKLLQ